MENKMSDYETVKSKFKYLFELYDLPEPKVIRKALKTDPCDVTDPPNEVRINTQDCDEDYQARHLFGHYLADLHLIDDQSDVVADIIAEMILEGKRLNKMENKTKTIKLTTFNDLGDCDRQDIDKLITEIISEEWSE